MKDNLILKLIIKLIIFIYVCATEKYLHAWQLELKNMRRNEVKIILNEHKQIIESNWMLQDIDNINYRKDVELSLSQP